MRKAPLGDIRILFTGSQVYKRLCPNYSVNTMARLVSSDPEMLLQLIDNLDSDFSDDEFDGYVSDNEESENMNDNEDRTDGYEESREVETEDALENEEDMEDDTETIDGVGEIGENNYNVQSDGEDAGIPEFRESPGPTCNLAGAEPVAFFNYLWTDELNTSILTETNRYGEQYIQSHREHLNAHPKSRAHDFQRKKFTLSDLLSFLAITIAMGIVSLPSIKSYWSTNWPFSSDNFRKIMPRDRFHLYSKFLHLSNNSTYIPQGQPGHDRLFKIRLLVDTLVKKFKSSYVPNKSVSVDESMISYKGRLAFLQYLPKKPHKWGIKAWVLADSQTGYTWNWHLYTGKMESADNSLPLSTRVVLSLCSELEGKGYHVFFDNFYTSPDLCKALYSKGLGCCGTVRLDRRGIPLEFRIKKLKKGEVTTYKDGPIL